MEIKKYEKLIYKYAAKVAAKHGGILHQDDLIAAGMRGMVEAQRTYNPDSGASLGTWIFIHARRYIQDEARQQRKAASENVTVRYGEWNTESDGGGFCNVTELLGADWDMEDRINRAQLAALLAQQIALLPPTQRKFLSWVLAGNDPSEYAREAGISRQATSWLYCEALKALRASFKKLKVVA